MKTLMKDAKWENWFNFLLGLWVLFIPWTFGEGFSANDVNVVSWNFVLVGATVSLLAIGSIKHLKNWTEWLMFFFGAWLILSPWFLLYSQERTLLWNSLASGVLITIASGFAIPIAEKRMYHRVFRHHLLTKH